MTVTRFSDWRLDGCGDRCSIRLHSVEAHEAFGRAQATAELTPTIVRTGPLVVDLGAHRVWVDGVEVPFGQKGGQATTGVWPLLVALARRPGQAISLADLSQDVMQCSLDRAIRHCLNIHASRLRQRLGVASRLITTVYGYGFRLEVEPPTMTGHPPIADKLAPQAQTWATADRLVTPDSAAYDALLSAISELVDEGERIAWSMSRRTEGPT